MDKKIKYINYIIILLLVVSLEIVMFGMPTHSRYTATVSLSQSLDIASAFYTGTFLDSTTINTEIGHTSTVRYQINNQDLSSNINETNMNFYFKLLDENNDEATKITISSVTIGETSYSYVSGKGYGPINLAYDGTTSDSKTANITLSCSRNFSDIQSNLAYKLILYVEDAVDSTLNTSQTTNLSINVSLYKATYELNGGTNNASNPSVYASDDTITLSNPTKSEYEFQGWYETSDFSSAQVTSISNRSSNITLYAKWRKILDYYFQLPPDWSTAYPSVYMYLYSSSNSSIKNAEYPGTLMTCVDNDKKIYKGSITEAQEGIYTNAIFSNGQTLTQQTRQSIDLTIGSLGQIFVPELYTPTSANEVRIFTTEYKSARPYVYMWNKTTKKNKVKWPGEQITVDKKVSGNGYYIKIDDRSVYNMFILNAGEGKDQTDDLSVPTYQDITVRLVGKKDQWFLRQYYDGNWHDYNTWLSSGYSSWLSGDYATFVAAKTVYGY